MILQNLKKYEIILGSKSPRRYELLKGLGINFKVKVIEDIEEKYPENLSKFEIPVFLAELKANAYKNELKPDTLLITADTIVWLNDKVIGKPTDRNDAIKILNKLSGNYHEVITGVCISTITKRTSFYVMTKVHFGNLTHEEIDFYIDLYKPYDKAGAYGVQEFIGYIGVDKIEGSYYNVMGLPIQRLYHELMKF